MRGRFTIGAALKAGAKLASPGGAPPLASWLPPNGAPDSEIPGFPEWFSPANWKPNEIPTGGNTVVISPATGPGVTGNATIGGLSLGDGSSTAIGLGGAVTVTGGFTGNGAIVIFADDGGPSGTLNLNGPSDLSGLATGGSNLAGIPNVNGTVTINGPSTILNGLTSFGNNVTNNGQMFIGGGNGGTLQIDGTFVNNSLVTLPPGISNVTGTGTFQNQGGIYVGGDPFGTPTPFNPTLTNLGTVTGTGWLLSPTQSPSVGVAVNAGGAPTVEFVVAYPTNQVGMVYVRVSGGPFGFGSMTLSTATNAGGQTSFLFDLQPGPYTVLAVVILTATRFGGTDTRDFTI